MQDKYLFIDRDGTLIREPEDEQVDSLEKMDYLSGVFRNLYLITHLLDYKLVMVSNQDGLGSEDYPREAFERVQSKLLTTLQGEGIVFEEVLIDESRASDPSPNRKPATGMVGRYLQKDFDREASFVIGDRLTDVQLAANMGLRGIRIAGFSEEMPGDLAESCALDAEGWDEIFTFLRSLGRSANIERITRETDIRGYLALDGSGRSQITTGLGFFDHMLDQLSRHGGLDIQLDVKGDLEVDEHHTVEDTGLALGQALREALGNKKGLSRYGFYVPMDESLAECVIDFGGRPYLSWKAEFKRERVGDMPTELFEHFFRSFSDEARCNLHIKANGKNEHHMIEAIFKAFARALRMAVKQDISDTSQPTTKGKL